jgi:putative hydrolase of the HAD superfamily
LRSHGIDDPELAAELAETFPRVRREKQVVFPDVLPVLAVLSNTYLLGLLSNGAPDLQKRKLDGSGLSGFFDEVLVSGEIGFGKPDRRIFELIMRRMGSEAENTLMIGDRLSTDVLGAHQTGLRAVWVNRSRRSGDGQILPEWEIASLDALMPILRACQ